MCWLLTPNTWGWGLSVCKGVKLAHKAKLDVQGSALKIGSGIRLYEIPRWT